MVDMLGAMIPFFKYHLLNLRFFSPGRFFAVSAIKTAFAHILTNYDVQFENGSMERPPSTFFEIATTPNGEAKLLFRKRVNG